MEIEFVFAFFAVAHWTYTFLRLRTTDLTIRNTTATTKTTIIIFDSKALFETLPLVDRHNVQHEYYLTEVPELMLRRGLKVETFRIADGGALRGVNTPEDLALCDKILTAAR